MFQALQNKWTHLVGLLALVILVAWACTSEPVASPADIAYYPEFHQGWSQSVEGAWVPLEDIRAFERTQAGEPLRFQCVLPEIHQGQALLFYSENKEVICTVDEEIIHSFIMQPGFTALGTPGDAWNQVDLLPSMGGKVLTMSIYAPIPYYQSYINNIYFVDGQNVNGVRTELLWFRGVTALGIFILMVLAFLNSWVWKNPERKEFFFAQGELYLVVFMWTLGKLNVFELFFARPIVSYLIKEVFLRLMPVALWRLAANSTNRLDRPRLFYFTGGMSIANAILPWVMQFLFGVSLLDMMWLHAITMSLVLIGLLIVIGRKVVRFQELGEEEYPCLPLLFIFIGGICDTVLAHVFPQGHMLMGVGSVAGTTLYTISIYLIFSVLDANTAEEKVRVEHAYMRLQTVALMQQMKTHFIFNTINTISALCKENAKEADRALRTFAVYLRSYMYLTNQQSRVDFKEERKLIEAYLTIEQMRFGDKVSFTLDTDFQKFLVPPLCIQTLVENAVTHGIRGLDGAGWVHIATEQHGAFAQIVVQDNGVGFDTTIPFLATSTGLTNVQKQLDLIPQATLSLQSQPGRGTKVVVTMPLHLPGESAERLRGVI